MEIFEAIEKRYSCRDLSPVEIPDEQLERILNAGRRAASGRNVQPFEFLVVKDRESIDKIATAQSFISGASVVVCIVADPKASRYWLEDISAAAENMLLAIAAFGYGSTWVEGTLMSKEDELKDYLGIPKDRRFMIALPIGTPTSEGSQAPKRPLSDIVRWEKW